MDIQDAYVTTQPSHQNILDLFEGEWSSRLPDELGLVTKPGTAGLFADGRVSWAEEVLGGFSNRNILELGPLEGGHSYMLQRGNASRVVSIESNTRAFLKCLCVKEIFKLDKVEFRLGDFMSYLEDEDSKYDMVFASGVLYHMVDPIKLLHMISKVSDRLFLWTHYYDEEAISSNPELSHKFESASSYEYEGVSYSYYKQSYKEALDWAGFCGGPESVSKWLTRDGILDALKQFGFVDIQISFEEVDHPNGPAFGVCAKK